MANQHAKTDLQVAPFIPSQGLKTFAFSAIGIGLIGLCIGLLQNPERVWPAYLTAFFFVSCLSLGGLFFTAINHLTNAGWSASIRRMSEGMTSFVPMILVGSLILLFGAKNLYPWMNADVVADNEVLAGKSAYLNIPFMVIRILVFACGMWIFRNIMVGNSLKQDKTGDDGLTAKSVKPSIAFILFFAITFSLFSVDLLMSLMPMWYSTIFGIYAFSGLFQSSLAFLILLLIYVKRNNLVSGYITIEHIHDCAKFLKGFTVFWAYIAFSQFMLIWYANIPEETEFYLMRSHFGWMSISIGLLIFKFIVPFLALLPRWAKRTENHLVAVCMLILAMQYVDIYWIVYPNFNDNHLVFGFYEVALLLGFLGLFVLSMMKFFQKNSLVAIKDPRMQEALSHHVTY